MLTQLYKPRLDSLSTHPYGRKIESQADIKKSSSAFEWSAFSALIAKLNELDIKQIYQCRDARVDGYIQLTNGAWVMLEIKTKLHWQSFCTGLIQCMIGSQKCGISSSDALIVFGDFGNDWKRDSRKRENTLSRWQILERHRLEVSHLFNIHAIHLDLSSDDFFYTYFPDTNGEPQN